MTTKMKMSTLGSMAAAFMFGLIACSDGTPGDTGGKSGSGTGPAGAAGSGHGGTGGSSTGGGAGSGGAAGSGGSTGGGGGGGGAGAAGGGAAGGGAAGTGGTAGTGGANDAGDPPRDGSSGSDAGRDGGAGSGGSAGGDTRDARADAVDAPTGTGGNAGAAGGDAAPPMCAPLTAAAAPAFVVVPPKGTPTSLDIAAWNIEWFGDTGYGPTDENLQRDNVGDVISGTDFDLWGLEEVVSTPQFNQVMARLPGYRGFLSDDPIVEQGSSWYTGTEQKLGFVYKCGVATVTRARVILTSANTPFAGRPPLEVTLKVTLNGATMDLVVIVVHAKCCSDAESYIRRRDGAVALKPFLDSTYPTQKVIVIGDFNDDLDTSITPGETSPYANFLGDTADYTFISKALTDMRQASTVSYPDTIDHHLATNEMAATFIAGSIGVYDLTSIVTNYGATTTDHYPVLSRYSVP